LLGLNSLRFHCCFMGIGPSWSLIKFDLFFKLLTIVVMPSLCVITRVDWIRALCFNVHVDSNGTCTYIKTKHDIPKNKSQNQWLKWLTYCSPSGNFARRLNVTCYPRPMEIYIKFRDGLLVIPRKEFNCFPSSISLKWSK
jgi:hypothetical protein